MRIMCSAPFLLFFTMPAMTSPTLSAILLYPRLSRMRYASQLVTQRRRSYGGPSTPLPVSADPMSPRTKASRSAKSDRDASDAPSDADAALAMAPGTGWR